MTKIFKLLLVMACAVLISIGVCSCNAEDPDVEYFEYKLSYDKTYYSIEDVKDVSITSATIPSSYNGLPVKEIETNAFYECIYLKSITVPNSVTVINRGAFNGCIALESITMPFLTVEEIDGSRSWGQIFTTQRYMRNSCVPENLRKITITDGKEIPKQAFDRIESVKEIVLPATVEIIKDYAFMGCESLETINIPDSVTQIWSSAFEGCESLKSISIPDSVSAIGSKAFYNCESLEKVVIEDLSKWCEIYFTDADSNPLQYGKPYLKGNGSYITALEIPNGVESISAYAFCNCDTITSVQISASINSIGEYAFSGCSSLNSVYFQAYDNWSVSDSISIMGRKTPVAASVIQNDREMAVNLTTDYPRYKWTRE